MHTLFKALKLVVQKKMAKAFLHDGSNFYRCRNLKKIHEIKMTLEVKSRQILKFLIKILSGFYRKKEFLKIILKLENIFQLHM